MTEGKGDMRNDNDRKSQTRMDRDSRRRQRQRYKKIVDNLDLEREIGSFTAIRQVLPVKGF